ncbi:MAG: DUF2911 domain-containing protein [Cyclobacteriaceae bacterium]
MKNIITKAVFFTLTFFLAGTTYAQLTMPEGSQRATVSQKVGITDITIDYGRPKVNDREIWGKLVPYGFNDLGFGTSKAAPWRSGANMNPTIEFTDDVKVEGQFIAAGKYGFHTAIQENGEVIIIFSKDNDAWGSYFYEEKNDALRVTVQSKETDHTELLTFTFPEVDANSTTAVLKWEKKAIPFKIDVDVSTIVLNKIKKDFIGSAGFTQSNWDQAAGYAMLSGQLEQALEWVNGSIEGNFFSRPTFNNLSMKSQILRSLGREKEADEMVGKIIALGNTNELFQYGSQLQAAGKFDLALEVHEANVTKSKGAWPSNYGVARTYSAKGDYKKAMKAIKASQKYAPERFGSRLDGDLIKLKKGEDIN